MRAIHLSKKLTNGAFLWCCLLCCAWWLQFLSLWTKSWSVTIQLKATEQHFPVVLYIILYMVVLTCESVDQILKCVHSNESYWPVISLVLFIMLHMVVLTFESVDEIPNCDHSSESYWADQELKTCRIIWFALTVYVSYGFKIFCNPSCWIVCCR